MIRSWYERMIGKPYTSLDYELMALGVIILILLAAVILAVPAPAFGVDRTPTPICGIGIETMPEVEFSAGIADGLATRVTTFQQGGVIDSSTITFWPCWWDERSGESLPFCEWDFAMQRGTGAVEAYAWSMEIAFFRERDGEIEIGEWALCGDELVCNSRECAPGEIDTYFGWDELCVDELFPCCGNPDCPQDIAAILP